MRRLAIVVQRYGPGITGGAEYHARWVVSRLRDKFEITVFTTTALDYLTWEAHYPAGEEELDGARVRRFPIRRQREMESFDRYSAWLLNEPHRDVDEERWLLQQGPVVPELVEALRREKMRYDMFFFLTYIYYPTVKGIVEVGDRAVLLPTAHDEKPIRLRIYRDVFAAPAGFILNTETELRFLESRFDLGHRPRVVTGMGIDWPETDPDPKPVLERLGLRKPYVLSFGRLNIGKSHDVVFRGFQKSTANLDLVLFGKLEIEPPDDPRIRYIGYLTEEEKWAVIAGAVLTIHPSLYESLSLALLESWAVGVPAVVNARCAVLLDHAETCGGALHYRREEELSEAIDTLASDPELRKRMGEAGRQYARSRYRADEVADRYVEFFNRMIDLRGQ